MMKMKKYELAYWEIYLIKINKSQWEIRNKSSASKNSSDKTAPKCTRQVWYKNKLLRQ